MTRTYTLQVASAQDIHEQRERYDALLARLGPPDRQAAAAFLAQRDDNEAPVDPEDAALAARFRARFNLGANAVTPPA